MSRIAHRWLAKPQVIECKNANGLEMLSIAVMCRVHESDTIAHIVKSYEQKIAHFTIVLDTDDDQDIRIFSSALTENHGVKPVLLQRITFGYRKLNGDFGKQRNLLQKLSKTPWILHLDSDEALSDAVFEALRWLLPAAQRQGLKLLHIRRINLVDQEPTDHYPDWCPSIVARDVEISGKVHEDVVGVAWWQKGYCPFGHKIHFIKGARLPMRDRAYEELDHSKKEVIENEATLLRTPLAIEGDHRNILLEEINSTKKYYLYATSK